MGDSDVEQPDDRFDQESARFDVWMTHTRWLYEDARYRFDSLGRQATALIAISGVLLGLLAAAEVRDPRNPNLLVAAVSADVVGALLSLWALRPRYLSVVNIGDFRDQWRGAAREAVSADAVSARDAAPMTEALLHGGPAREHNGPGPLQELTDAAKNRGWEVFSASVAVTLAVLLVGVYLAIGALT